MTAWLYADEVIGLYGQGERWIDRRGTPHALERMDTRYLRNVRRFVERNMVNHLFAAALRLPPPHLNGEMAQFAAEQEYDRMVGEALHWTAYPNDCPLYRAICFHLATRRRYRRWRRGS